MIRASECSWSRHLEITVFVNADRHGVTYSTHETAVAVGIVECQQVGCALPVHSDPAGIEPLVDEQSRRAEIHSARHIADGQAPDAAYTSRSRTAKLGAIAAEDQVVPTADPDQLKHFQMCKT
jgi:hypothetical protein